MTGFEMPTVKPYQPPLCVCGHPAGDHKSNRARGLSLRFGVCLRDGCDCREYRDSGWRKVDENDVSVGYEHTGRSDDPEPPEAA